MTYYVQAPSSVRSRGYGQNPQIQSRFNTLIRKASQLCQMSQSEVYMMVRHDGNFYVFNSVDASSRTFPEPQVCFTHAFADIHLKLKDNEVVVNVAVAGNKIEKND
jgi:hypothetical protein